MLTFLCGFVMAITLVFAGIALWLAWEILFGVAAIEEKHDEEKDLTNNPK